MSLQIFSSSFSPFSVSRSWDHNIGSFAPGCTRFQEAAICDETHYASSTVHPVTSALPSAQGWAGIVSGFHPTQPSSSWPWPPQTHPMLSSPRKTDMAFIVSCNHFTYHAKPQSQTGPRLPALQHLQGTFPHQTLEVLFLILLLAAENA